MSNTNKNKMTNKFKEAVIGKRAEAGSEDRAMGRIIIMIGIVIAAVVLLLVMRSVTVGNYTLMAWVYSNIYPWLRWIAAALVVAAVVWFVYSRYFALRDETDSLFTTGEIVGCAAAFAYSLWYLYAGDNFYPTLVFVIAVGVLGILSQMVSPIFFRFTLLTCLGAWLWWIVYTGDKTLGSVGLYVIAAIIIALFAAVKISDGKYPADKDVRVPLVPAFLALAALCVLTAVLSLTAAVVMPYVVYAYLALFLATGIICTFSRR